MSGDGPSLLFVCMGNVCRSPTAEGVMRHLLEREAPRLWVRLDSAGTHSYHLGAAPDARAVAPAGGAARLQLFLDYAPQQPLREVPDPYYGEPDDFERVLDLSLAAARGLLQQLRALPAA